MDGSIIYRRLRALEEARGRESRLLEIGDWRFRISGLDRELADALDRRWGGFIATGEGSPPVMSLRVLDGGAEGWLDRAKPGEAYRFEATLEQGRPVACSYSLATCPDDEAAGWRAAISDSSDEPPERTLENVVRYLLARVAVERGGFSLHGAGVLRDGQAHLFGGGSRSGKSTVVALSRPLISLGDDYALTVPSERGWVAPAVPFDNSERAPAEPPRGWFSLAGIWRLHQASAARVEKPPSSQAAASLMACVAFAWAIPDLAGAALRHVEGFVAESRFAHLHFRKSPDFWKRIDEAEGRV